MNLDHDFVQVSKLNEDQKKVFTKNRTLFFPNSGEDQKIKVFTKNRTLFFFEFKWTPTLRCTPESNYWGRSDVDHTQTMGGYSQIIGGIYLPSPGFRHPCANAWQSFISSDIISHAPVYQRFSFDLPIVI